MKYTDLVALTRNGSLNHIDANCKLMPRYKDNDKNIDVERHRIEYISQGLEIDLAKKLYRSNFGADHRSNYIKNGFSIKDGWNQIGESVIEDRWTDDRDLLGIYDITNFEHIQTMLNDAIHANQDYSNAD